MNEIKVKEIKKTNAKTKTVTHKKKKQIYKKISNMEKIKK
jgi:hypothetical protein